jgi:hypothetical protein
MQRIAFLKSFAADTRAKIAWLSAELERHKARLPQHRLLIARLHRSLDEARAKLTFLDLIIAAAHPALMPGATPWVHTIESGLELVGTSYLPVLQRQGDGERFVRGLLFAAARATGMVWLQDIAVRLDGPHAAIVSLPTMPIIYAPPRHEVALVDMPGLYHELGHAAFARDRTIGAALEDTVRLHFSRHRRQAGMLSPDKRAVRQAAIDNAEAYWTHERLAEVFCDILATIVCGPAHYVSFVDLGLRHQAGPFELVPGAHPPMRARVCACYAALSLPHRQEPLVSLVHDAWAAHESEHARGHDYAITCDDGLLDDLVRVARGEVVRSLPALVPFSGPLPLAASLHEIPPDASLELILNCAAAVLFLDPDGYAAWELTALAQCKRIAEVELARRAKTATPDVDGAPSPGLSAGSHRIVRV